MGNINGRVVIGSGRISGGAFTLTVPATGTAALLGAANVFAALNTFQALISSPHTSHAGSERFGAGANITGASGVAVGANTAAGQQGTAVGTSANSGSLNSVAVGTSALASGTSGTAVGSSANAAASATAVGKSSVALAAQFVAGSDTVPMTNVFFGKGATNAVPTAYVINGTGGSGTDIAGADVVLASGKGTGTGAPGRVVLQNAPAGSTGASLNTLRDRWSLEAVGNLAVWQQTDTPATRQVGSITPTFPTAADATRKGRVVHTVFDTAEREGFRIEADGAAPMIGFLGAAAVVRAAHIVDPTGGTPDAEARTAINAILVVLENLGFTATS